MLTGGVKYFVTALLCIFALSILCVIAKGLYNDRQAKKAAGRKRMDKAGRLGMAVHQAASFSRPLMGLTASRAVFWRAAP